MAVLRLALDYVMTFTNDPMIYETEKSTMLRYTARTKQKEGKKSMNKRDTLLAICPAATLTIGLRVQRTQHPKSHAETSRRSAATPTAGI